MRMRYGSSSESETGRRRRGRHRPSRSRPPPSRAGRGSSGASAPAPSGPRCARRPRARRRRPRWRRPGRRTVRLGMERSDRSWEIGLMGGAVFAEEDRVVGEDIGDGRPMSAARRIDGRMVVGDDQEVPPYGRKSPESAMPLSAEPMACSRTPKKKFRPAGSAAEKASSPSSQVLFESGQVGGAADQGRHGAGDGVEDLARGTAGRDRPSLGAKAGRLSCQPAARRPWRRSSSSRAAPDGRPCSPA